MEKINGNDILCEFDLEEAKNSEGKEIEISACVHKVKKMGGFAFVILRTARYLIQSVYSPETCPDSIDGIKEGCFVTVKGTVRRDDRAYNGIEISMTGIKLIHKPEFDYPLHVSARKIGCTLDVNLDNRSVALRNPVERAVFKFQEGVVSGFREFMIKNKFTSSSGSRSNLFFALLPLISVTASSNFTAGISVISGISAFSIFISFA
jgi:aspartyl/asparaginyl-tRNA synthetase